MKKLFFVAILGMSALVAHAQQWAGSTTTSDTIYRYGVTQMRPTTTHVPYSEWTPEKIRVYRYNDADWKWETVSIEWDGIHLTRNVPAPSNYATIGHGTFTFRTNADTYPYSNWYQLEFNNQGVLSSNGKIITTDSVVAHNVKATSSVKGAYAFFTGTISGNKVSINGATTSDTYRLAVNSGILCEELKVMADVPSSDFVFEPNYNLKPLSEVEAYVTENKHLPDVPSAKEFKENGYKVGEMDNLLLQKIEELTLYIIDLQKQIEELKCE